MSEQDNKQSESFLSDEDWKQVQSDIEAAKKGLSSKEESPKKQPVVKQQSGDEDKIVSKVLAKLQAEQQAKEAEEARKAEEKARLESLESAQKRIEELEKKLSESGSSQQVVKMKSPFDNEKGSINTDTITPEKEREIDEASLRAFWDRKGKY